MLAICFTKVICGAELSQMGRARLLGLHCKEVLDVSSAFCDRMGLQCFSQNRLKRKFWILEKKKKKNVRSNG